MRDYPNLVVVIGASAGGLQEIVKIVASLPASFAGSIIVATHRDPQNAVPNLLPEILDARTQVSVEEPINNEYLSCSTIYVGTANQRVEVVEGGEFKVEIDATRFARMKRIDDLFVSVAETAGENAIGVVLSGRLSDGASGLAAIKKAGGYCFVQHPEDALFDSMPLEALDRVNVDFVGSVDEIAAHIVQIAAGRTCED